MDISQTRHSCKACAQYYDDVQFQFKLAYTQKIRREIIQYVSHFLWRAAGFSVYHVGYWL